MRIEKHLVGEGTSATLTAYLLERSPEMDNVPRPAVIVVPGGAFHRVTDREGEPIALAFVAEGCQSFVLDYTTTTGEDGVGAFPACIEELCRAVTLVREHAQVWDIDERRVYAAGFSAGGQLTLLYANTSDAVAERLGIARELARVDGTIGGYPLTSFLLPKRPGVLAYERDHKPGMTPAFHRSIWGHAPTEDELRELSPLEHVGPHTPPAFLFHTAEDPVCDVRNTLAYASALAGEEVPVEVHVFEQGPHGYALAATASRGVGTPMVSEDVAQWVPLAMRWVRREHHASLAAEDGLIARGV